MEIVRQQWKELGHFGNPRSNETLYNNFQIRFSTKKVLFRLFLRVSFTSDMNREEPNEKCQDQRRRNDRYSDRSI